MDLKRLAVVLLQRLAPVYIAVALSWVTGYVVFTIGGIGLAIAKLGVLRWPDHGEDFRQAALRRNQRRKGLSKARTEQSEDVHK